MDASCGTSTNSMADTEEFFQAVCSYPFLYNVSLHHYRRSERRKAWREVAASIGLSVVECNLRNEEGGRYLHYWAHREISFLDARMRKRKRHSEAEALEELCDRSRTCQNSTEGQDPGTLLPASASHANANGTMEEKEIVRSCDKPVLDRALDEDELFLLSYVPALKRLKPQKRAAVKMKIQQLMFDAEFRDE
ncbi:hypothetical protein E1301_Tti022034 [Triplophysa tibetana]|uniref:BESS domain-containing protein n=1 Tax=Triplophysa tibetana TaxID=1572043 RepID=A0A5A9P687_9TELE|nr:hypothetical protein E1301_Tti022034 [Triplophysa tibetana]